MARGREVTQGDGNAGPGGSRANAAYPMCVGGWTLTARFRCLIRPNPLVRPVPPQPARVNSNTLSLEVSLVTLLLPPAIGGQRA